MKIFKILSLVILFHVSHAAIADGRLASGKIDSFKLGSLQIVIGDRLFKMEHNVRVYNERRRQVSHGALTRGRTIYYRSHRVQGERAEVITEIFLESPST